MRALILVVCISFIAGIDLMAQTDSNKQKNEKQVQANEKKLVNFYKKAMLDSIANMYSNNCYYAHEFMTRLQSRDEVKKKVRDDFMAGYKVIDLVFTADDMKSYDDVILVTGMLSIKYVDPLTKATLAKKYNYNMVWKESSDKKFRIRSEVWTPVENPCK